jgi:hypothetical protein
MHRPQLALLIFVLVPFQLRAADRPPTFDEGLFRHELYPNLLCFDLRTDENPPVAAVIATVTPTTAPQWQSLIVPIPVKEVGVRRDLLVSWASYSPFTIINYAVGPGSFGTYSVAITPAPQPNVEPNTSDAALPAGLYFTADRLTRKLILVRSSAKEEFGDSLPLPHTIVDAVAVALPHLESDQVPAKRPFLSPSATHSRGPVRYFNLAGPADGRLIVQYVVDATEGQRQVETFGFKVLGALAVPLVTFALMRRAAVKRAWLRRLIIVVLLVAQVVVVVAVVLVWRRTGRGGSDDSIVEFGIAGIGLLTEIAAFLVKTPEEPEADA